MEKNTIHLVTEDRTATICGAKLTVPRERPILFSGPMVRAILAGRKTQTRRVQRRPECFEDFEFLAPEDCPYGAPGDVLWVRETWCELGRDCYIEPNQPHDLLSTRYGTPRRNGAAYRAECNADSESARVELGYKWSPSIFMPRWASRLSLRVTDVRVERLQEMSLADARAEGIPQMHGEAVALGLIKPRGALTDNAPCSIDEWDNRTSAENFARLWDTINGERAPWSSNPWVWVVSFEKEARP